MSLVDIPIQELKIGMFIHLEMRWWKHPFLHNSFVIRSNKEIEQIKQSGLKSIKYDPEKSLPERAVSGATDSADKTPQPEPASPSPPAVDPEAEAASAKRRMRKEFLLERRKNLAKREEEYKTACSHVSGIIKSFEVNKETGIASAQGVVEKVVDEMLQESEIIVHLINLNEEDSLAYFHPLNVSILSLILGKGLELPKADLGELGMAALFHDIGKQKIPKNVWRKKPPFTKPEREFLELHPKYGFQMLAESPSVTQRVRDAIYQHHEKCNGQGYPQRLAADSINYIAKIIAVVDTYDNLTNQSAQGASFTPHDAMSFMYTRLQSELSGDVIIALIKNLGVYPPGTFVELSNGKLGLVIRSEQNNSMRPTLILYDETSPREEAPIIHLPEEEDLNIVRSLRPPDVPPMVMAYLRPGRMTGFFVGPTTFSPPPQSEAQAWFKR
jgi:HD-GYP domain-containing protein (c-di-GMP phosphodiesterase class II)